MAERWRYNAIISCKEAIIDPMAELDHRMAIKLNFQSSLEKIKKALGEKIGQYVKVSEDEHMLELINSIPVRAARLWLDMGTQRCRFRVKLLGPILSPLERVRVAQDETLQMESRLELNLDPEVLKYGNENGQQLGEETVLRKGSLGTLDGEVSSSEPADLPVPTVHP
jgi:hypothetical protein